MITVDLVKKMLRYEPQTGKLFWTTARGSKTAGSEAGCIDRKRNNSYLRIRINGTILYAHRVAWAIVSGSWPEEEIDHINGDGLDNRIFNLRSVPREENAKNQALRQGNVLGVMGVHWHKNKIWRAEITVSGKNVHLGVFDSFHAAVSARRAAERKYGFHKNHGRIGCHLVDDTWEEHNARRAQEAA